MAGPEPNLGPFWTDRQCQVLAAAVLTLALVLAVVHLQSAAGPRPEPPDLRIDPNTAPFEVIQTLPKIGPTRARAWIDARTAGSFRSLVDLENRIVGVGPATSLVIGPFVRFEMPAESGRSPGPGPTVDPTATAAAAAPARPAP